MAPYLLQYLTTGSESIDVCILEHPTFVYCARFHPASPNNTVVVTGSYDKVVRIWTKSEGGDDAEDVRFDVSQVGNYLRDIMSNNVHVFHSE